MRNQIKTIMHKNIDKTELFNCVQMCYLQVLPIVKPINNNSFLCYVYVMCKYAM